MTWKLSETPLLINGEEAISSLVSGFSMAASGNLVGAVGAVVNLFSHHPDVGAMRQQQIMEGLSHISQQLNQISQKLDIIDNRLIEIQKQLNQIAITNKDEFQTYAGSARRHQQRPFRCLR